MHKLQLHKQAYVTAAFLLTIGLVMAFLAPKVTEPVSATPPGNIFVANGYNSGGGSACTVNTVAGRCYTDLQVAIANALPGATLNIGSGGYMPTAINPYYPSTHAFIIDKPLNLVGDNSAAVLLIPANGENVIGGAGDILTAGNTLIIVRSSGVNLQNMTIDGDNPLTSGAVNARNGIVIDYALGGVDGSGLTLQSVLLQHFGYRGVYAGNPGNAAIANITIANSTIQGIGGSGNDIGFEVVGAVDNIYVTDSAFSSMTSALVSGLGSDIQAYRNSFTFVNQGIYVYSPRNGKSSSYLGNAFANAQGANSAAILLRNHDATAVVMNNTITGFATGLGLIVDDAANYGGETEVFANFINGNTIGISVTKSAAVNVALVIGRNGEPNKFSSNNTDIKLNPGMNNSVMAQYNIWSGGRTFAEIESRISHKGIMPTGSAAAADGNDNSALGQVDYGFPTDSLHSISLDFPLPDHPSIYYNHSEGLDLQATAIYDPYGVSRINYRMGNRANSAQDSCEDLYNLPDGGQYDLGNASPFGTNKFLKSGIDISSFSEGNYILCAFMIPGSGTAKPAFNLANAGSENIILDNTAPGAPTTIGWALTNPPTDLNTISNSSGYLTCNSWINRNYVINGANVWNSVSDSFSGLDHYNYQVYSPDYGRVQNVAAGLSFSSPAPANYYHLPLSVNGIDDGDYYVRISTTDHAGNSGPWSGINNNPATWCRFRLDATPPTLTIPNYSIPEGFGNLLLTATAADHNGTTGYEWDLDNNGSFETVTGTTNTATLSGSNFVNGPTTRTVRVRTADPAGNVTTTTSTISVTNIPPVVSILSSQTALVGLPASLVASFIDIGQETSWTVHVDYGDSHSSDFSVSSTGSLPIPSHTYSASGTYTVTVQVNDGTDTASSSASVTVNPNANNNIGVAINANPVIPNAGQNVSFSAVITNPNNVTITSYTWNFGDSNTATGANVNHTYASVGNYNVTLVVHTQPGGTFNASTTIIVVTPYTPGNTGGGGGGNGGYYTGGTITPITIDAGPDQQVGVGEPAVFTAKTTGPATSLTYKWDFGDGSQGTGANATHAYNKIGGYTVRLTVGGYSGGDLTDTLTVTVVAEDQNRLNSNTDDVDELDGSSVLGASVGQAKGIFGLPLSTLNNMCLIGLVAGLLFIILFLIWRRRREDEEEDEATNEDEFDSYLQRKQSTSPATAETGLKKRTRVKRRSDDPRSLGFKM